MQVFAPTSASGTLPHRPIGDHEQYVSRVDHNHHIGQKSVQFALRMAFTRKKLRRTGEITASRPILDRRKHGTDCAFSWFEQRHSFD
jgi:hypothetical protein